LKELCKKDSTVLAAFSVGRANRARQAGKAMLAKMITDFQPKACYVVYPGKTAYPLIKSVEVLPLTQINKIWE
jgi:hypothetical protein